MNYETIDKLVKDHYKKDDEIVEKTLLKNN